MSKFLVILTIGLLLTSCEIYSKKIKDWDGLDLIGFILITYTIIFFGYQIIVSLFKDNKKK